MALRLVEREAIRVLHVGTPYKFKATNRHPSLGADFFGSSGEVVGEFRMRQAAKWAMQG